jgi:peptidoglycan/xylan/chitin deacetylase (PgdA/CDA1 family)
MERSYFPNFLRRLALRQTARRATALLLFTAASCATGRVSPAPDPSGGTAAAMPPDGFAVSAVPQFVQFGFDDNGISGAEGSLTTGGVRWVRELFESRRNPAGRGNATTYDGTPARFSFYVATRYIEAPDTDRPELLKREWRAVADAGHEVGLHTHSHPHGEGFNTAQWVHEIELCKAWLAKPFAESASAANGIGVAAASISGFRTPYLEHGLPLFPALRQAGLDYDCSVEEGFEERFDGRNFVWPYRVADGYGAAQESDLAARELWELPVYALIVPPDSECERYGVPSGLRERLKTRIDYFDPADGKITGFDWNLWVAFGMSREEFVATFKYSLDLRLQGNRAPFTFGTHSDIYSEQYENLPGSSAAERRQALAEVLDYALAQPDVRVVAARDIVAWLRQPRPL